MATATMARGAATRDVTVSYRGLGAGWMVYGVLRLGIAVWLVGLTRQATVMFGATLVEVAHPESLMAMFHMCSLFAIILSVASGVTALLAGPRALDRAEVRADTRDCCGVFVAERVADRDYVGAVYALGTVPAASEVGVTVVFGRFSNDSSTA